MHVATSFLEFGGFKYKEGCQGCCIGMAKGFVGIAGIAC